MKKIFMGYCAFAPFFALAMTCQFSGLLGIRDDDELMRLAFTTMICTTPLCGWLYYQSGHMGLAYIMIDAHMVMLALPFIPRRCYEFSVILSLLIAGYGLLLIWDKLPKPVPVKIRSSYGYRPMHLSRWDSPDIIDDECPGV